MVVGVQEIDCGVIIDDIFDYAKIKATVRPRLHESPEKDYSLQPSGIVVYINIWQHTYMYMGSDASWARDSSLRQEITGVTRMRFACHAQSLSVSARRDEVYVPFGDVSPSINMARMS